MAGLKRKLSLGITGLALVLGGFLYSQNQKPLEKRDLENKVGYEIAVSDTIKTESKEIISKRKEFVENAKKYLGTEYIWGGRLTKKNPGLDCMGLVFRTYAKTFKEDWTKYSVMPSDLIKNNTFGKSVKGLDGVLSKNIERFKLEEGDIIYFLTSVKIEKHVKEINGNKYYVGHMGIYSDKKNDMILNAYCYGTKVREEKLDNLIGSLFEGIYITRPDWKK